MRRRRNRVQNRVGSVFLSRTSFIIRRHQTRHLHLLAGLMLRPHTHTHSVDPRQGHAEFQKKKTLSTKTNHGSAVMKGLSARRSQQMKQASAVISTRQRPDLCRQIQAEILERRDKGDCGAAQTSNSANTFLINLPQHCNTTKRHEERDYVTTAGEWLLFFLPYRDSSGQSAGAPSPP